MTYEELSQIYREEKKGKSLTPVRPDLYRSMADLMSRLNQEYARLIAIDPDSIMAEGANQHRKNAEKLIKFILSVRSRKICVKAVNAADGANEELASLTPEEREYYLQIVDLSRRQLSLVDHYRGRTTVATRIDEPIRAPVEEPAVKEPEPEPEPVVEDAAIPVEEPEMFDDPMDSTFDEPEPVVIPTKADVPDVEVVPENNDIRDESVVLRILEDLPPFVGPDRDYELHKEDIVTLPKAMAAILINSQKAVAVTPAP